LLFSYSFFVKITKEEISSQPDKMLMLVRSSMLKELEHISGIEGGKYHLLDVGWLPKKTKCHEIYLISAKPEFHASSNTYQRPCRC